MAEITYQHQPAQPEQSGHAEIRETNEAEEIFEMDNEDETVLADADDESSQLSDKTLAKHFNHPPKKKSKIQVLQRKLSWKKRNFLYGKSE